MPRIELPPLDADSFEARRFWSFAEKGQDDECWLWRGGLQGAGYGRLTVSGVRQLAHRIAFQLAYGAIPEGHLVHHECEVQLCVNPAHLRAVRPGEHVEIHVPFASYYDRRRAITHCPRGHEYTPENTIQEKNGRCCRECKRQAWRRWYRRRKEVACPV